MHFLRQTSKPVFLRARSSFDRKAIFGGKFPAAVGGGFVDLATNGGERGEMSKTEDPLCIMSGLVDKGLIF